MAFFQSAISTLQTLVTHLQDLDMGSYQPLEGYGNDNPVQSQNETAYGWWRCGNDWSWQLFHFFPVCFKKGKVEV